MATKVKLIANDIITTSQIDLTSLDSHFTGGTGVSYSSGTITIGQPVATTDNVTFADLTVTGNLNITGDINSYNVTDLDVTDQTITLGAGQIESNSGGSGIIVDGSGASILWDETNTEWDFNNSINVTGTVVADGGLIEGSTGLTIRNDASGANEPKLVFDNDLFAGANYGKIQTGNGGLQLILESPSTSTFQNRHKIVLNGGGSDDITFSFSTDNGTSYKNSFKIENNDISFYEDTGTTAKLFWDASAENLGIGNNNPTNDFTIGTNLGTGYVISAQTDNQYGLILQTTEASPSDNALIWARTADSNATVSSVFRVNNNGKVKIGSGTPAFYEGSGLEIERAGITTLRLQNTSTAKSTELTMDAHIKLEALNSSMDIQLRPTRRVEIGAPPSGQMGMLDIYKASGALSEVVQRVWNSNTSWAAESLTRYYSDSFSGSFPVADIGFYRGDDGDNNSSGFIVKTGTTASNVSEKFKVDALGNVLIRNTTGQKLSLENTAAAPTNSVSNAPFIEFKGNGWDSNAGSETISAKIEHVGVYGDYGFGATQGALVFSLQGAGGLNSAPETMQEGMRIAAGGDDIGTPRVGIGTTDPKAALHVVGTGQFDMLTIERSASTPGVKFVSGADTAGTFGFQLMDNNEWWSGVYNGSSYDYWIQANTDALRVKKPISSFSDSGAKQYSHLCTGSFYQSTGAIVIDTNIPGYNSTDNANMFSIKIRGFEYAVYGSIDMVIGGYVGENNHYSINYNGNYVPEGWVDSVQFCKNNTTGNLAIVLGSTSAIQRIEMAVVDFIQGFQNVNESYAKGWSMSCLTSLSNYSNFSSAEPRISSPRPGFHAYLSSTTSFASGTAARTLASTTYNRGGHYDTSNGRFTAPTDGVYHFDMALQMQSSTVNQTYISAEVRVNGGTRYIGGWYNKTTGGNNNGTTYAAATGSVTIPLGRGDYIEYICELASTDTALGGLAGYTYLSGVQIG
jgi:hypothetical protein